MTNLPSGRITGVIREQRGVALKIKGSTSRGYWYVAIIGETINGPFGTETTARRVLSGNKRTHSKTMHLCKVSGIPKNYEDKYPFKNGDAVLFMGEIEQMPGHAVIALKDGRVLSGYDSEWFERIADEDA